MRVIRVGPDGCGVSEWDEPIYPDSPHGSQLRAARMEPYRNLRETGRLLGLTAEQISGLETGRYTLSDEDWTELFSLLSRPR